MTRLAVCVVLVTMLMTVGIAVAQEGQQESWADRINVSGYFQFRYIDTDQANMFDTFDFTRMYVTIRGDIDKRNTGIITFARVGPGDPNIDLYNAFVDYMIDEQYRVQVGQVPTWFGLEGWQGSSQRLAFERAKIIQAGPGFYWQGASDRGIWFRRQPADPDEPMVIAGVCNGQFRADDANDDKNIELHLKWQQDWGVFGASWMDGTFVNVGGETDRSAWGAYIRLTPGALCDVGGQAEYLDGDLLGAERDGWYGQVEYDVGTGKDTLFARYEEFNASVNAANFAEYTGWSVGWVHRVYDSSQITVQYTDGDWSRTGTVDNATGNAGEDLFGAQWQYAFR